MCSLVYIQVYTIENWYDSNNNEYNIDGTNHSFKFLAQAPPLLYSASSFKSKCMYY